VFKVPPDRKAPDYSELFASEQLSDLTIILEEEGIEDTGAIASSTEDAQPAAKRRTTQSLAALLLLLELSAAAAEAAAADADGSCSKKKVLPGHSIVLFGCSAFCKTKLQNWRSDDSAGKLEICVTVPAGAP
jgi:hypothetical protein